MIDVIIVSHEKDLDTLEICIKQVKENIIDLDKIYVISENKFTDNAIWFDEKQFPFTKEMISVYTDHKKQSGWYIQQLYKLYAWKIIPGIKNYVHIDADVIFLNPVSFFDGDIALYDYNTLYHDPYYQHMGKLLGIKRIFPDKTGMVHHQLYLHDVMKRMFEIAEYDRYKTFWQLCMESVTRGEINGLSELDLYFNFIFTYFPDRCKLRKLRTTNDYLRDYNNYKAYKNKYDYIGFHKYMRGG